eukprot:CAMPEP_0117477622 /NCGR_PEP_ID=MMETSP0784-20121206/10919_1 /TAXON_ID=39447 /ORGANISM="" /LENGTH=112 /DNA_ID=CAMNT_0005271933 /DNA_START=581 /DNA_END=915 /DNA_ORIENTATION=+
MHAVVIEPPVTTDNLGGPNPLENLAALRCGRGRQPGRLRDRRRRPECGECGLEHLRLWQARVQASATEFVRSVGQLLVAEFDVVVVDVFIVFVSVAREPGVAGSAAAVALVA